MSYNHMFPNYPQHPTFHNFVIPPPPPPPQFFIPPTPTLNPEIKDQDFIKQFEKILPVVKLKTKPISISKVREKICQIASLLNDLKAQEKKLTDNMATLSEDEWNLAMKQIEDQKSVVNNMLIEINEDSCLDLLRKLLAKRTAKRMRLKRLHSERTREKKEMMKEREEQSRKIDENLRKIRDTISIAKQEEESKAQADIILREVRRKKADAKKCISKMDALLKLRKARHNTVTGRGETVSEPETLKFHGKIDLLKSMWTQKLAIYEKEELELRSKLEESSKPLSIVEQNAKEVANNLTLWREALFGGMLPQVNFEGNKSMFVAVRSSWDRYLRADGSTLPVGWVPPPSEVGAPRRPPTCLSVGDTQHLETI